jgi:hypothetical protein
LCIKGIVFFSFWQVIHAIPRLNWIVIYLWISLGLHFFCVYMNAVNGILHQFLHMTTSERFVACSCTRVVIILIV